MIDLPSLQSGIMKIVLMTRRINCSAVKRKSSHSILSGMLSSRKYKYKAQSCVLLEISGWSFICEKLILHDDYINPHSTAWSLCMKSVFILAYLATICWLMWIIQSPTSSLFPAPCLVLERDLSCSTSLSYRPVSSFIQLYLYRLLAATNSGSLLPFDYTWILLSQTEPT